MGKNPVFNVEAKKSEFLRLFAAGNNISQCCLLIGISRTSWQRWFKADHNFASTFEKIKAGKANELLNDSVETLSSWHEEEVIETETTEMTVDDEGKPVAVKTKRKKIRKPPSVPALKMLANKYDRTYNDKDNAESNITIRITQRDRSLSIEERLKLLEEDAKGMIEDVEYKEIIDPPIEDS